MHERRVSDIDWARWTAVDPATLIFVIRGGQILLIRKKRGLGAGNPAKSPIHASAWRPRLRVER